MSVYWHFKCQDCDERTEDGLNHGQHALAHIWNNREVIADLLGWTKDAYLDVTIQVRGYTEPVYFLEKHKDHKMILLNEYGGYYPLPWRGEPERKL